MAVEPNRLAVVILRVLKSWRTHSLAALIFCILLLKCSKSSTNYSEEANALEGAFPILEAEKVTAFRFQNWCQLIDYNRGCYASSMERTCIYITKHPPGPFDSISKADIDKVWQALKATKVDIMMLYDIKFENNGALVYGVFECNGGMQRRRYIFDPGYSLPNDIPEEREYFTINSNWYLLVEDWN